MKIKDKIKVWVGTKCEFWNTCPYYKDNSATCNKDGGGSYCGAWREFKRK